MTAWVFAACSSTQAMPDGGVDAAPDIAALDAPADACGPIDAGFSPATMSPPRAPHAGVCTSAEASDYATCVTGMTPSLCGEFDAGSGAACRACAESQSTDPVWGVVVFTGGSPVYNLEGCIDDALGQTSLEKASGGAGSCGDLLFALYGCEQAACTGCQGSAHDACTAAALTCGSFSDAVGSSSGPCGALDSDAPPAAVASCFPNTNIKDPAAQQADWVGRMVSYMCGS